jgi:predicted DNA-binding transcriptional regulator
LTIIKNPNKPILIDRSAVNDPHLKYIELAVYVYLLSLPDGAELKISEIEDRFFPSGRSLLHALTTLSRHGYITYNGPTGQGDHDD